MIVSSESVDVAMINLDLLNVREAITNWNAIACVVGSGARLFRSRVLRSKYKFKFALITLSIVKRCTLRCLKHFPSLKFRSILNMGIMLRE